ncbi:MAG: alpha-N-arabinofuranosidase [Thermaceae bacterium]|nr:alpha-N-arabinofuranosidase [Thermaceae bacterium]
MNNPSARIYLDTQRVISEISPLIFGGFAEHMGRCVYEGIYDPSSPHADAHGLRKDVLAALREIGYTVMRYPGGNFVSGYRWLDGVGPKESRPRRREMAWKSIETNRFGTDEFMHFAREIDTEPMLAVNLGTGTIQEAADLVEYCNAPTGSYYSDLRAKNGHAEPYGVKYWCLGNEMDGPWQIGHLEAHDYGRKALEAAKLMRLQDSQVKLIACGSSNDHMPTYPEWDRTVLEHVYEQVDYLSLHYYVGNRNNNASDYLASAVIFENQLDTLAATLRYVKSKLRSKREVYLSWDEWNIWYKNMEMNGDWQEAPHLIEEVYNLEDALVVAQWLSVFLRRADVLKVACIAQIVNIIAPLLTTKTQVLKQSIFYPLMLFSRNARGHSLDVLVESPKYPTSYNEQPLLDVSASHDPATGKGAVFIVNRSQNQSLETEVVWQSGTPARITAIHQMSGTDLKAANSFEHPEVLTSKALPVVPVQAGKAKLTLPPLSFTAVVTSS